MLRVMRGFVHLAVLLLAVGCGSSEAGSAGSGASGAGGSGGTGSFDASGGASGGAMDAAADGTLDAYPPGPYGNQVGDVLADLETQGYLRHDATGLAYEAPFGTVRLSDVRATAPVAHAVIHVSGFT